MSGARPMSSRRWARSSSSAPRHTTTRPPTAIDTGHTRLAAKPSPMAPSTRSTATEATVTNASATATVRPSARARRPIDVRRLLGAGPTSHADDVGGEPRPARRAPGARRRTGSGWPRRRSRAEMPPATPPTMRSVVLRRSGPRHPRRAPPGAAPAPPGPGPGHDPDPGADPDRGPGGGPGGGGYDGGASEGGGGRCRHASRAPVRARGRPRRRRRPRWGPRRARPARPAQRARRYVDDPMACAPSTTGVRPPTPPRRAAGRNLGSSPIPGRVGIPDDRAMDLHRPPSTRPTPARPSDEPSRDGNRRSGHPPPGTGPDAPAGDSPDDTSAPRRPGHPAARGSPGGRPPPAPPGGWDASAPAARPWRATAGGRYDGRAPPRAGRRGRRARRLPRHRRRHRPHRLRGAGGAGRLGRAALRGGVAAHPGRGHRAGPSCTTSSSAAPPAQPDRHRARHRHRHHRAVEPVLERPVVAATGTAGSAASGSSSGCAPWRWPWSCWSRAGGAAGSPLRWMLLTTLDRRGGGRRRAVATVFSVEALERRAAAGRRRRHPVAARRRPPRWRRTYRLAIGNMRVDLSDVAFRPGTTHVTAIGRHRQPRRGAPARAGRERLRPLRHGRRPGVRPERRRVLDGPDDGRPSVGADAPVHDTPRIVLDAQAGRGSGPGHPGCVPDDLPAWAT